MRVREIGGVQIHKPLQWDDCAVGWDTVAHVGVFFLGLVRECAGQDGAPAEDFFHASQCVLQIRLVIEGWGARVADYSVEFFLG